MSKVLRKIAIIICVGAIYNLYFAILNGPDRLIFNFISFLIIAYIELVILDALFYTSLIFQRNGYLQIITIFLLSSVCEILYAEINGADLRASIDLVILGIPLTVFGLVAWKCYLTKVNNLLIRKKNSFKEQL